MRLAAVLHDAATHLLNNHCATDLDSARLEAELLYAQAAGWDRVHVLAAGNEEAGTAALTGFTLLLMRRLKHEPLAYILGHREFYGMDFLVGPGVLVPRPETETLVEATLAAIRAHPRARREVRVTDVGTGSGAVALAVARHAPQVRMTAIDVSTEALAVAGRNRDRFELRDRVTLLTGDLLEPLSEPQDVIVANLPYIPSDDVDALPAEIRESEPRLAVDGGDDGTALIRRLISQLPGHLAPDAGAALFEVGAGQALYVGELLQATLGTEPAYHRDLAGIRRVVEIRLGF